MTKLVDLITEISTGNVANVITKRILKKLKQDHNDFIIDDIYKVLQGKFKEIFKDIEIHVGQLRSQDNEVHGFTLLKSPINGIGLIIDKKFADRIRSGDKNAIKFGKSEILTIIEHEVTHVLHFKKHPKADKAKYTKFQQDSNEYMKKYIDDYREIEAHANQLIKFAKDNNISAEKASKYYAARFNINWKKLYKKLYKKGAFN